VAQDRLFQGLQLGARLQAELVGQPAVRGAVGRQRIGLAPRSVERKHQLRPQALTQGMLEHECVQLADQLGMAAGRKLGVDARLEGGQPQGVQTGDVRLDEGLVGEVGERRSPPERERLAKQLAGIRRIGCSRRIQERLEARDIELLGFHMERVAGRARHQTIGPELLAQPGHAHLDRLGGGDRRAFAPERLRDPIRRDGLVGVQQEERKDRALLRPAEWNRATVLEDLQRAEKSEFHVTPLARATVPAAVGALLPL
jgi:hypothetical protein